MADYIVSSTGITQVTIDEVTYTGTPVTSLAAANAVAGDTIYIANGEVLDAQGKTTLKSVAVIGGTDTVISGNVVSANGGAAMQISRVSQLAGMTFYNNRNNKTNGDGGALLASGTVTIKNVIFDYNRTKGTEGFGGAAKITGTNSLVSISGTSFINNETEAANGGALCVDSTAAITVSDCFFNNNKNGALRVASSAAIGATVSGSTFTSVKDTIYVAENSTLRFTGSNTLNADIINDGTIEFADGAEVVFSGSETADLGGLDLSEVNISVAADVLTGNDALTIYSNVKLAGNQQISVGNGQYTLNDDFYIGNNKYCFTHTGSTLAFTKTTVTAGVVSSVENPMFKGNAVSAPRHSTLTGAFNAGCTDIILADNEILDAQGTSVFANAVTVTGGISTIIANNTGDTAGAIQNKSTTSLSGMTFYNNKSTNSKGGGGGAILNSETLMINNAVFDNNKSVLNGFAVKLTGSYGNAEIKNSRFTGNISSRNSVENAGALFITSKSTATIFDCYFADNTNGAVSIDSSAALAATISGCTFATARDTIYNAGIVKFSGENTINASLTGTGTFNVAENAVLTFNNTEEIDIAALTINTANSNSINLNGTLVNFITGLDVSKVTITVDGTGLEAGDVIATGITGTIDDDTVANVEKGYLDIVEGNLVLKVKTDKVGVLEENSSGSVYGGGSAVNDGTDITQMIASGLKQGTVFAGSEKGVDGKITTTVTGGTIAKHLYGGGKVSAESTELTVEGGSVGQDVYGGLLVKNATETISLGESKLTVSGGIFNQYVVGGCRITAADTTTTHTAGKVYLTLAGGNFAFAGTNTDPGASIFGAGYVHGFNNTAAVNAQYQVAESDVTVATDITGAVYGGAFVSKFGLAQVDSVNVTVSTGSVDRVFGGGWAQTNGISNVGEVSILIENSAKVDTIYAGGGNDRTGKTEVTGAVDITVTDTAAVKNIFMGGRYNNSLVSGDVTVTISGADKEFARISGDGAYLKNNGTSSLVIDTTATVALLDGVDKLTITDGSTLNLTDVDFAGLTEICFDLEDAKLDAADWTVITGVGLDAFENANFMIGDTEMTFADGVYTGSGFKVFEDEDGIKFATIA